MTQRIGKDDSYYQKGNWESVLCFYIISLSVEIQLPSHLS